MTLFAVSAGEILVSHWYVLAIGVAFLLLQLYLCRRFWARMRRHQRDLSTLLAEVLAGGDGRDVERFAKEIPWLRWVSDNFPQGRAPGNFAREDVLNELDLQIGSNRQYLLLQRAGIMAPLLGVIITVIGFMLLELPEAEDQSLGDLLFAVTPLVAGVGTGAVLAFINQWLLHLVGGKVEAVRYAARSWFDAAIWSGVGLDVQSATVKAISAMERMARAVTQTAESHEQSQQVLRSSVAAIDAASASFQQTCSAFGDRLQPLPDRLCELTAAASSAVETLDALVPVGQRAIGGLDASVTALRTAVEGHFVEAAKLHHTSNENLLEAVGRISESTQQLKLSSGDLQESVNAHANAFKGLNRSLQKQVLPAHEAFLGAMSQFNGRAEGLLDRLDNLHAEVIGSVEKMTSLAPDAAAAIASLSSTAAAFSDAVRERFCAAAERHHQAAGAIADSSQQLQQSARGLADGDAEMRRLVDLQGRLGEELGSVQQVLKRSVDQLAQTGTTLQQSLLGQVIPSQRAMQEAAGGFSESAARLRTLFDRDLDPVSQRLAQLDQTLARLEGTTRALSDFASAGPQVERLSGSLARAAKVADAIAALPQQVRSVLEEVVRTQNGQTADHSKGNVLSWLRGPRRTALERARRR